MEIPPGCEPEALYPLASGHGDVPVPETDIREIVRKDFLDPRVHSPSLRIVEHCRTLFQQSVDLRILVTAAVEAVWWREA